MFTTVRSITKTKFQSLPTLAGVCLATMGLNGCAGLVSSASSKPASSPLTISGAAAAAATMTGFQADWTTSVPATSQVNYGKTASYGSTTGINSSMVSTHQVPVASLTPGTTYHFQIQSTDANGDTASSSDMTVTTLADTVPPTVSITSPAAGATVSGTAVILSASASDNVAVASVQFKVDSVSTGSPVTTAPYTSAINTTTLSNGNHTLTAVATDTSGNTATSAAVTVQVNNTAPDTTPPTVSMTAPANGATVSSTVTVSANASDNVAVASVQFQLDNVNVGTADTASPYTYSWDTTKSTNGTHTLRAIATDTSNNSTTSASVTVTVNNAVDTTPPTVPTGLAAVAASSSQINLNWTASTDNVGVTGYKVFRGGAQVGTSPTNAYSDTGLTASTAYAYTVAAYDAAGNTSAQSASASATTLAASSGGSLPTALGWYQIPNTTYAPLCPSGQGGTCQDVIDAWNSGAADTKRNRLVFMGGGHSNYSGNEVYALDLNTLQMLRLDNPDPENNSGSDADPSGDPNSRHTYGGVSYIPSTDQIYLHGGALWPTGYGSVSTYLLNLSGMTWKQQDPVNGTPVASNCCNYITFSDYDPQTDLVWYTDSYDLWTYKAQTNTQTLVSPLSGNGLGYHQNCVVDYTARYFTCFGDGTVQRANMAASTPTLTDITSQTSGCSGLTNANNNPYPGLAYDPVQKKIVAWIGGSSVILFDSTALTCTTVSTYQNGPPAASPTGTLNRWRYFPALGIFALVNNWQQNAWVLRMTPVSGGGASAPTISGVSVGSITTTGATVSWTTNVAATSQVEYGTTTSYGTMTTLNSTQVTSHSVTLTGLTAGTTYHYAVLSTNSGGSQTSSDAVFTTNSSTDTTPPTVSITSPASGATVSGTITVTANASDNVGVTSVQFLLDGANLGSADTASPYQASWNTTTASNGTHTLTAKAMDAAGNVGNAVAVTVTVSNSGSTSSALQDFQNRCAAAGVIVCEGFDEPTGIPLAQNVGSGSSGAAVADDGTTVPTQDTSIVASGSGSLRFDIPVPSGAPNPDGYWRQLFQSSLTAGPTTATLFGQNSTFYVQFRQRMSPAYITNTWGGGTNWKQAIIAVDNSSCGAQEITTVNGNSTGFPQAYSDCGADGFIMSLANGDYLLEQGDVIGGTQIGSGAGYNCYYSEQHNPPPTQCFLYQPNVWMTFTYKVQVGTWGQPNSTIQAWATVNGQGYAGHEWLNMQNHVLNQDGGSVAAGFNTVYLTPYWTGGYSGASGPATTWYDELIVSSQPIAAPNN